MCFSAEASFAAAAVLGATGFLSLQQSMPDQRPLASLPFLFAAQQGVEGLLWLSLESALPPTLAGFLAPLFLTFAWVLWPALLPYALLRLEPPGPRRYWLLLFTALGILLALALAGSLLYYPVEVSVQQHHLQYFMKSDFSHPRILGVFYTVILILPLLLSHLKGMKALALLLGLSLLISFIFYRSILISVWCFMAALVSVAIYFILRRQRREWASLT